MSRDSLVSAPVLLVVVAVLLALVGCVTVVPRGGNATPAPVPAPTELPPTPAPTPTPEPTATPTPAPTPTPLRPTLTPNEDASLFLEVEGPEDGSTVPGLAVVVFGRTLSDAEVTVNEILAAVDANGGFRAIVDLSPGINDIQVIARSENGDAIRRVLRVTSLELPPPPFLLVIHEPEDQSVVDQAGLLLRGRTAPDAIVSVRRVTVEVDAFGDFSTIVRLEPGLNTIDVVATSADGQEESRVPLSVIYRPPEN